MTQEGFFETLARKSDKAFKNYLESKSPKARIKRVEEKLALLERQEKAELLEQRLKEKEAEYRKAHPKFLGISSSFFKKKLVRFLKPQKV